MRMTEIIKTLKENEETGPWNVDACTENNFHDMVMKYHEFAKSNPGAYWEGESNSNAKLTPDTQDHGDYIVSFGSEPHGYLVENGEFVDWYGSYDIGSAENNGPFNELMGTVLVDTSHNDYDVYHVFYFKAGYFGSYGDLRDAIGGLAIAAYG